MILEECIKVEINKQCPKVAMKKRTHIFQPPQKRAQPSCHGMHMLQRQLQAACMEGVEMGGVAMGMGQ